MRWAIARVRLPTSTTTSNLLFGSIAVQTQSDERSRRLMASSSLLSPALKSRSTAYNSSSCNCSRWRSQRKEAEKARSCSAASFLRNQGGISSGSNYAESELLQGDILHQRPSDVVSPPCQEGVRHGESYHDDDQPCQPVCLGRVSATALLLCPAAGTGAGATENRPLSSDRQSARWPVRDPVWRQDHLPKQCHDPP